MCPSRLAHCLQGDEINDENTGLMFPKAGVTPTMLLGIEAGAGSESSLSFQDPASTIPCEYFDGLRLSKIIEEDEGVHRSESSSSIFAKNPDQFFDQDIRFEMEDEAVDLTVISATRAVYIAPGRRDSGAATPLGTFGDNAIVSGRRLVHNPARWGRSRAVSAAANPSAPIASGPVAPVTATLSTTHPLPPRPVQVEIGTSILRGAHSNFLQNWNRERSIVDEVNEKMKERYARKENKQGFTRARILSEEVEESYLNPDVKEIADRMLEVYDRNPNYKGAITFFDLLNAESTAAENTALFIKHLPVDCRINEVFDLINHGRVFQYHFMEDPLADHPDPKKRKHFGAARLVFYTREAAEHFLNDVESGKGLTIRRGWSEWKIEARWNREPVGRGLLWYHARDMTRVVQFTGPAEDFMLETLESCLRDGLVYQTTSKTEEELPGGMKAIQIAFSSMRGQADSAVLAFKKAVKDNSWRPGCFLTQFVPDPCEPITGLYTPRSIASPTATDSKNWRLL